MDPVVHFEMPYDDAKRLAKFYATAFGWKTHVLGGAMGDYVLATTSQSSADGMPRKPGMINGGFFPRKPLWPAQYPSVVIAVGDLKAAMAKVASAGGEVLGEPMDIPGVGAYVAFNDTEGNRVGMLQPLPMKKAAKKPAGPKKPAVMKRRVVTKKIPKRRR